MKKLFIILAAVCMAVSGMAQTHLPRTYCGCTLGKTTYSDVNATHSKLPESARLVWGLANSKEVCVYAGDFVVEDHHFSILSLKFHNDTLYKMEFRDEEVNNDIMELNRAFIHNYKKKYSPLKKWLSSEDSDDEEFVSCSKTDGEICVNMLGSKRSLELTYSYERIANDALRASFGSLRIGPNYDEKNKVTSIAGVRFGETLTNTINAFKQRGTLLKNDGKEVYFSDVTFGGLSYNNAVFYFQYDTKRFCNVLAAAKFEKNFYEWRKEEALMTYESVVHTFQEKYTNCTVLIDEDYKKAMVCGMLESDYEDGNIPPITITLDLGVSRGGDKYYYVTVTYFGMNMSDSATEDI